MTYQKLADWLVPVLLGWGVYSLQTISVELSKLNQNMAVVVTKVDNHESRLIRLELNPPR